jgi:hypothetical protein
MDLGTFKDNIRLEANKGSSLDSIIPAKIRQAAFFLEDNYDLPYMRRFVEFSTSARSFQQPERIKAIEWLRLVQKDGYFRYLPHVESQDISRRRDAEPEGWWLDANEYLWFDNAPTEELTFEMVYTRFTDWPTDDDASPWLLRFGEQAMVGQTMLLLLPYMREVELGQSYKLMRDEALNTMLRRVDEHNFSAAEMRMRYDPVQ